MNTHAGTSRRGFIRTTSAMAAVAPFGAIAATPETSDRGPSLNPGTSMKIGF
ncbi:MAG: twin-arginine translocation signal domain-containing protein, partial [Verrucomicrobiae bacterium]|nr:twin-arginine translocation signal domain-containing protein [Verrucomicrobiae bacterium]